MDEARSVGRATIVLVHGGFVARSGCEGVYRALCEERCHVAIVQNPTLSLEDDVATTQRVIAASPDPVVLVGHSYGGAVVTQAGSDSKVKALVYLAALVPNHGEAVDSLLKNAPPAAPLSPILPPHDGFLLLDQKSLLPPSPLMCPGARPTPWRHRKCLGGTSQADTWSQPGGKMIALEMQREMAERTVSKVVELAGSHAIYISQAHAVASLIRKAAASIAGV